MRLEAAFPTNLDQVRAGKRKTKDADRPIDASAGDKNSCIMAPDGP